MLLDLFQPQVNQDILHRIQQLMPETQRKWGKMEVSQMMSHVSQLLELALGDRIEPLSNRFILKIARPFIKKMVFSDKPYKPNLPTGPSFIVANPKVFETEQKRLLVLVERFGAVGEAGITKHPHPAFGVLTPAEWSLSQWKHLDHHLKQFGV